MEKNISLNSICTSVENELIDESPNGDSQTSSRTVERRFKEYLRRKRIDISDLKKDGKISFGEAEAAFLKAFLKEAVDTKSFAYKYITGTDKEASFEEIATFMEKIDLRMKNELSEQERLEYMSYLDQNLKYSSMCILHDIFNLCKCLNWNMNNTIYTFHLDALEKLRKKLEREFVSNTVETIEHLIELTAFRDSVINGIFEGEKINIYDCDDKAIEEEYSQRDRDVLEYLKANPLIKQHIEEKLKKKVEDIY